MKNHPRNHAGVIKGIKRGGICVATGGRRDLDNPNAIVGDISLFFRMIIKVLQFVLLSKVMDTPTTLTDGRKSAQVFDQLLS